MSRTPKLCMFCGEEISSVDLTMEHPVPRGLWEQGHRPQGMRTLPAHKTCNNGFSPDDEYFRNVMLLEDGAVQNCDAARIVDSQTVERMLQKRPGTLIKAAKNLREVRVADASGNSSIRPVFDVDVSRIERVLFKVMKGIFYIAQKTPMPQDFVLEVCDTNLVDGAPFRRTVESMVDWQSFGDDAFQCRYLVIGRPAAAFACLMRFYQNRLFYGAALSPPFADQERSRDVFVPCRKGSSILVPSWRTH